MCAVCQSRAGVSAMMQQEKMKPEPESEVRNLTLNQINVYITIHTCMNKTM